MNANVNRMGQIPKQNKSLVKLDFIETHVLLTVAQATKKQNPVLLAQPSTFFFCI